MFSRTLIITPHFDDETIGCGGTIHQLMRSPSNKVKVVVVATNRDVYNYSAGRVVTNDERYLESTRALKVLGLTSKDLVQLSGFEDGKLDRCDKKALVTQLDKIIREFRPTAVLFPYSSHHQDHQAVYSASIAALRPTVDTNFIRFKAAYEYPYVTSYSSNINQSSKVYFQLTDEDIEKKEEALRSYDSQLNRDDRDILSVPSILTLARVRGTEIGQRYAEAFYPISVILNEVKE